MGVPGDAADLVTEAGAGLAFEPGNPAALAAAVRHDPGLQHELGRLGYRHEIACDFRMRDRHRPPVADLLAK